MREAMSRREDAQVHVLEMITLFWLFFMTATFILQLRVPDPVSPAADASLHLAADDAFDVLIGEAAEDDANHSSRLGEMLADDGGDAACDALLDELRISTRGNCWVALNAEERTRMGDGSQPEGRTLSIHRLVADGGDVWTVTLQVWHTGGGA